MIQRTRNVRDETTSFYTKHFLIFLDKVDGGVLVEVNAVNDENAIDGITLCHNPSDIKETIAKGMKAVIDKLTNGTQNFFSPSHQFITIY